MSSFAIRQQSLTPGVCNCMVFSFKPDEDAELGFFCKDSSYMCLWQLVVIEQQVIHRIFSKKIKCIYTSL